MAFLGKIRETVTKRIFVTTMAVTIFTLSTMTTALAHGHGHGGMFAKKEKNRGKVPK